MSTPVAYQAAVRYNEPSLTYAAAALGLHGWIADDIEIFYESLADGGLALECTIANSVANPFLGILSTADAQFWGDSGPATTHTLRYMADTSIKSGVLLYVDGAQYTVTHTPQRINREELLARLILNP